MLKMLAGFETCIKTIMPITDPSHDQWSSAGWWPHFNQMPFQLISIPHWFLINMFLRVSFSWCHQALLHWCGFHAARVKVNGAYYWDVLLLKQLLPDIGQAAGDFWLNFQHTTSHVHKSTELLRHKTPDFTPDIWPPNTPDLSSIDYMIWTITEECIYQKW